MTRIAECPDIARLQDLLDGVLADSEQAELTCHLDRCTRCQEHLETLAAGGQPRGAVSRLGRWRLQSEPALGRAMAALKEFPTGESEALSASRPASRIGRTTGEDADTGGGDGEPVLDFLTPSEDESSLGRFGPYEVLEVIGHGGMGIVLKGRDPALGRLVAIKVLAPQLAASGAARKRFAREARAAAAVSNEHVVAIHAVDTAGGLPYLVMQYVAGPSLQQRLDRDGPLELEEILRIGMQTAAGLGAAHAQGVVHRDIKPANILLENGVERVKITDFGLARVIDDATVTQSGYLSGTPAYMAPEQARGDSVDHRADLFSLGSVVYALCTGRPPFRASTVHGLLRRVVDEQPRPVREINPRIPEWLVEIMNRLHTKDPAHRFQSAAEVTTVFADCLAHVQQPTRAPLPWFLRQVESRRQRPRGRRTWAMVALLALLLGVGLAAGTVMRIRTADGTLVVEVSDPNVHVSVDGQEVVISGAGIAEVRLKAGQHKVQASKDGKPVLTRLVDIQRDGKELVKVSLESGGPAVGRIGPMPVEKTRAPAITELKGHQGKVSALKFSPDGKLLVSVGIDRTIRLWNWASGRVVATIEGHKAPIIATTFSVDGRTLLSVGEDGSVRLWDIATGKALAELNLGIALKVSALDAGARRLATANGGTVRVWDVQTGKILSNSILSNSTSAERVSTLAFSPDGKTLAVSGADKTVRLWDAATGKERRVLASHAARVWSVAFSPDGRTLVSGTEGTIRLWDAATGKELRRLRGLGGPITSLVTSPDGRQLATASADTLSIFDLATGKRMASLPGGGPITCLTYSPDGQGLAWATADGVIRVWKGTSTASAAPTPRGATEMQRLREELEALRAEAERQRQRAQHSEAAARAEAVTARQAEIKAKEQANRAQRELYFRTLQQAQQAWEQDNHARTQKLLEGTAPELRNWEWHYLQRLGGAKGSLVLTYPTAVRSVAFSPDARRVAAGGEDGTIRVWDAESSKEVLRLGGLKTGVNGIAFSPDGRTVASANDNALVLWDFAGQVRARTEMKDTRALAVAFSPDGKLVAVTGSAGTVRLIDDSTGREVALVSGFKGSGHGVAFSPDGKVLTVAADEGVFQWDVATGKMLRGLGGHTSSVRSVAFSPDGSRMASGDADGIIRVWDPAAGKIIYSMKGHKGAVLGVAYGPDGTRLATAGVDGTVRLWDTRIGQVALTLTGHKDGVTSIAFSPDGKRIASGSADKTVRLWPANGALPLRP